MKRSRGHRSLVFVRIVSLIDLTSITKPSILDVSSNSYGLYFMTSSTFVPRKAPGASNILKIDPVWVASDDR